MRDIVKGSSELLSFEFSDGKPDGVSKFLTARDNCRHNFTGSQYSLLLVDGNFDAMSYI